MATKTKTELEPETEATADGATDDAIEPSACSSASLGLENEKADAWNGFMRSHTLISRALESGLVANFGLQMSGYEALSRLDRAEEGHLRMSDLAAATMLSQSRISRLATELSSRGLLERQTCDSDTRVVYAVITDAGRELVARIREHQSEQIQRLFFDGLSQKQIEDLGRIWPRVLDALT